MPPAARAGGEGGGGLLVHGLTGRGYKMPPPAEALRGNSHRRRAWGNWVCLFGFGSTHGQDAHATGTVFTFQTAGGGRGAEFWPSVYGRDVDELCEFFWG